MSFLAEDKSNCWPLVSTMRTGMVGVKPIAVSLAQHSVPAGSIINTEGRTSKLKSEQNHRCAGCLAAEI